MNSDQKQIFNLFQLYDSNSEFEAIEQFTINQEQFLDCVHLFKKSKKFNHNCYFQQSIVYSLQDQRSRAEDPSLRILQFGPTQQVPTYPISSLIHSFSSNDLQNLSTEGHLDNQPNSDSWSFFILQQKTRVNKPAFDSEHAIRFNLKKEIDIDSSQYFPKKYKNSISTTRFRCRFTFFLNQHLKIDLTQVFDNSNFKYEIEYEVINLTSISLSIFNKLYKSIINFHKKLFLVIYNVSTYVSNMEKQSVLSDYQKLFQSFFPSSSSLQFVGPKSIALEKQNLIQFYNTPCILNNYTVTEKADGFRNSIFINSLGHVFLIDMQFNVKNTNIHLPQQQNSIIDCELILRPRTHIVAIFDIYFYKNKLVSNLPLLTNQSNSRLHLIDLVLSNLHNSSQSQSKYSFTKKTFLTFDSTNIESIIKKSYKKKYKYNIDGLIFTPNFLPVGANIYDTLTSKLTGTWNYQFKWKVDEQNTADFYVQSKKLAPDSFLLSLFVKGNLSAFQGEGYSLHTQFKPNPSLISNSYGIHYYDSIYSNQNINDEVWEFFFQNNSWHPLKKRLDKSNMFKSNKLSAVNDIQVVQQIKKISQYPVTYQDFTKYHKSIIPTDIINYLISNTSLYYSRTIPRQFFKIKDMNNFHSKSIKFPLYRQAFQLSNVQNSYIKSSIVELAVGKAGDIHKLSAAGFKKLLGFDIFSDNIQNIVDGAIARSIQTHKYKLSYLYLIADVSQNLFLQKSYSDKESLQIFKSLFNVSNNKKFHIDKHIFGTVSCQFAIHYMFKNTLSLDTFINNLDNFLAPGGTFIGTTLDKQYIVDLFRSHNSDSVRRYKDDILLWQIDLLYQKSSLSNWYPKHLFGNQLRVYVESINFPSDEYLFDFDIFQSKLLQKNITLISKSRFSDYPQFHSLSPSEQLYSNLNISFVFQKQSA